MSHLSGLAIILGTALLGWHLCLALAPRAAGRWLAAFPRHVGAGRLLAAAAVAWTAWLVWQADVAWLERWRLPLCILSPVFFLLIIFFVDDLLAPRALGGLLLLLPAAMLEAAFGHPARSRLVVTTLAYLLAILGMALVWSPYLFYKWTAPWRQRPAVVRLAGAAGAALGLALILLGALVY